MKMPDGIGLFLIGLGMLIVIFIGMFTSYPLPEGTSVPTLLFGTQGIVPAVISFATLVGAAVTVRLLFKRARHDQEQLDHARQTARISLFKDAVVLLGQNDVAALNAINILFDLAKTYPREFLGHTLNGLTAFVSEKTFEPWREHIEKMRQESTTEPANRRSQLVVLNALGVIGTIRPPEQAHWPLYVGSGSGRFEIGPFYLERGNLRNIDLSYCDLRQVIWNGVLIVNGDFTETHIELIAVGAVRFYECTFSNSSFDLRDNAGRFIDHPDFSATITFEKCNVHKLSKVGAMALQGDMIVGGQPTARVY